MIIDLALVFFSKIAILILLFLWFCNFVVWVVLVVVFCFVFVFCLFVVVVGVFCVFFLCVFFVFVFLFFVVVFFGGGAGVAGECLFVYLPVFDFVATVVMLLLLLQLK